MPNIGLISFNSGYLSPQIDARSDTEKYGSGCRILENFIPMIYGGVTKRPGTKYVATSKNAGEAVRLIPFIYSADIAYTCEFGNKYIRFYYGGEVLFNDGIPAEVSSPYLIADIPQLQIKQIGDTMRIVHSSYAPKKLSRTTVTTFSLDTIIFEKGPFRTRNDLDAADGVTLECDVTAKGDTGNLTASSATFASTHVDSIWELTQTREDTVTKLSTGGTDTSIAIDVDGEFSFITRGTWTGTVIIQRNENAVGWETFRTYNGENDRNVSLTTTETEDNVQYRIHAEITSGTVNTDLTANSPTRNGIVRIDSVASDTVAGITVLKALASTNTTIRWAEGAWSDNRGYPTAIASHHERIIYGGTTTDLQTLWLSEVGDYEDFAEGLNDADSFSLVLTTTNDIKWIGSLSTLAIGTSGSEYQLSASELYQPITPTNYSIKRQTTYGSAAIQPVLVGDSILFVDSVGRKIRETTYQDLEEKLVSPDLSVLAEDITISGVVSIAYQKNPDAIVWCTLSDGTLLSMTYERDQIVIAWAKYPIGGDGFVNSVARIPSIDEDEIWISVTRIIDNSSVTYIEQMQPRLFGNQEDAFFVDSGIIHDSGATDTITGLDHLERQIVKILGDGAVITPQIVLNGSITLPETVSKAIIGLQYTSRLQPMRMDVSNQTGTTKGSIKKITEVVISFFKTFNATYGDGVNTHEIDWRTTEKHDNPPEMFTGDKEEIFDGGFSTEDPIIISCSDPTPCTVRAIIARTEKTGR